VPAPEQPWRWRLLPPALIAVSVVLAFLPSMGNGFTNWDDDINLTENPEYRGLGPTQLRWMWSSFLMGHYQPLSWMSLGLDYVLWGMDPFGYHLSSVLIHAANAVLLYYVILALLRVGSPSPTPWPALAGALLHAIHPLRVESVTWVTERRDVLCGLFVLLSLLAYLKRAELERQGLPSTKWLLLSCLAFAASLLAKALGIMLPLVLLLLDGVPLERWNARSWKRLLVEKVPFLMLSAADAVIMIAAMRHIDQVRPMTGYSLPERVAQAAYGLCFYPLKTLWPAGLMPIYRLDAPLDPWQAKYLIPLLAVVTATAALWVRRRRWPAGLAAWACYVGLLLPVLGLVVTGFQVAADRYTYLAMIPAAVLVAAGLDRLFRSGSPARRPVVAVLTGVLALLAVATLRQTGVWKDSVTLWSQQLRFDPECSLAYNSRGGAKQNLGDSTGALEDCLKALSLDPASAGAHLNCGLARVRLGQPDAAIRDFDAHLRLAPKSAKGYLNRGVARSRLGDVGAAILDFDAHLQLAPKSAQGYQDRGIARLQKHDLDGALADLREALVLGGPTPELQVARGRIRGAKGDLKGAAEDFEAALRSAPQDWPLRRDTQGLLEMARRQAGGR
jgi:Tfp pilus assembly protein PilF